MARQYKKFFEYTAVDFKNMGNAITTRTFKDRQKIKGRNNKGTIFVNFEQGPGIAKYLCEPTKKFSATEYDPHGNVKGNTVAYEVQVLFDKWRDWFDDWKSVSMQDFQDFLKVCDLKWYCSCPSFQMMGMKYELDQAGAAIYGETRPDNKWRLKKGNKRPSICKHCLAVDEKLLRYPQLVYKEIKSKV